MYACGIAKRAENNQTKHKQITNEKLKVNEKKKCSVEKAKKILHHRSGTIIQLHAIVYAVIYYDFRTTLWRLSV